MPLSTLHLCQNVGFGKELYIYNSLLHMIPWIIQMLLQIRQKFSSNSSFFYILGRWSTQQQQRVFPKHKRDQHNIKVLNQ
jgi:hypothetical protein